MITIPYIIAIYAIYYLYVVPKNEVGHWYRKANYPRTYAHCLQSVRGKVFWPKIGKEPIAPLLVEKKTLGMLRKMRRKAPDERR